jgi:hypothetical protein
VDLDLPTCTGGLNLPGPSQAWSRLELELPKTCTLPMKSAQDSDCMDRPIFSRRMQVPTLKKILGGVSFKKKICK